jgi:hypothetical protein
MSEHPKSEDKDPDDPPSIPPEPPDNDPVPDYESGRKPGLEDNQSKLTLFKKSP